MVDCTGTLVAPRALVTAGHCMVLGQPHYVFFGPDPQGAGTYLNVLSTAVHPDFDLETLSADIGMVVTDDFELAETAASVAKATVGAADAAMAQAKASLNTAKVNLSYTNIVSPINGTVISRSVDVGQTVAASLQAPVIFTIAEDLRKMQVNTNVAESDVGRLQNGME